jgi:hypothetical protein
VTAGYLSESQPNYVAPDYRDIRADPEIHALKISVQPDPKLGKVQVVVSAMWQIVGVAGKFADQYAHYHCLTLKRLSVAN